jgi:membrane dipeptidase
MKKDVGISMGLLESLKPSEEERALELHKKAIVINALSYFSFRDEPGSLQRFQDYYRILVDGGITSVNLTVAVYDNLGQACRNIAWVLRGMESVGLDRICLIKSAEDIKRAKELGIPGIILGFQNSDPLEGDISLLSLFRRIGVMVIQPTYSTRSLAGDGCFERMDGGLSRFGLELIEEMNRLGILVDLSHCGDKTTLEAIEASKDPVSFTHTTVRALKPMNWRRAKTDEAIQALAEKGGVLGIVAESTFLKDGGGATFEDYIAHIKYVINLVGIDHVGLGPDIQEFQRKENVDRLRALAQKRWTEAKDRYPEAWYQSHTYYETFYVKGFETMAKTINVTKALVASGFSDSEILKILGLNFLRLFQRVWRH